MAASLYIVDCRSNLVASTNAVGGGGQVTSWYAEGQLEVKKHFCNIKTYTPCDALLGTWRTAYQKLKLT